MFLIHLSDQIAIEIRIILGDQIKIFQHDQRFSFCPVTYLRKNAKICITADGLLYPADG